MAWANPFHRHANDSVAGLLQAASIAAAQHDDASARRHLIALLEQSPAHPEGELLLAEVDLRLGIGSVRLERTLRKLIAKGDSVSLRRAVLKVWQELKPAALTPSFSYELATALSRLNDPRLDDAAEQLLERAATATGPVAAKAELLMAELAAKGRLSPAKGAKAAAAVRSRSEASPVAAARADVLLTQLSGEPVAEVHAAMLLSLTRDGLRVYGRGEERIVPYRSVLAVHVGVAPVAARRLLIVDLVLRYASPMGPAMALRLTSDDRTVPSLYPTLEVPQAWATFITRLVEVARAQRLPTGGAEQFQAFDSLDAVTRSWSQLRFNPPAAAVPPPRQSRP